MLEIVDSHLTLILKIIKNKLNNHFKRECTIIQKIQQTNQGKDLNK